MGAGLVVYFTDKPWLLDWYNLTVHLDLDGMGFSMLRHGGRGKT
jgi:hypothetical protein